MKRLILCVVFACVSGAALFAAETTESIKIGQESVSLKIFNPEKDNLPVVILIHGARGVRGLRAARYDGYGNELMSNNIIGIIVHYFDAKSVNWEESIAEAVNFAERLPNAAKARIGMVGYSTGATLALKLASKDSRIKLLVLDTMFLPAGFSKSDAASLPKTFIMCGSQDKALNDMLTLREWLSASGVPFQERITQGKGPKSASVETYDADWQAALKFFKDNL
ncbi:MAG: dienelactone hydrolase family protein [Candidatus Omnitrophica bacterium]|nr:dienelactone hydrolase family protein [Candidatus Omnitrophota bacterium]